MDERLTRLLGNGTNKEENSFGTIFLSIMIVIMFILLTFKTFLIFPVIVNGDSMDNTVYSGEYLWSIKASSVEKNEIVCVYVRDSSGNPTKIIIKRVIAVEGDTVNIKDGKVYINGVQEVLPETCESTLTNTRGSAVSFPITVGENQFFVLGDNRIVSSDSRTYGLFDFDDIYGVVPEWAIEHNKILKYII